MRILILTKYGNLGASSRLRLSQYVPYLRAKRWVVDVSPLLSDKYLQLVYGRKSTVLQVFIGYLRRAITLLKAFRYDVLIIEKELFPFLPAWVESLLSLARIRYIVDLDDAQFHSYDLSESRLIRTFMGTKIDTVIQRASLVIAGNSYIATRARNVGSDRVVVIPTVVDLSKYQPRYRGNSSTPVIGWVGTPKTSHYLLDVLDAFAVLSSEMSVRFIAVGGDTTMLLPSSIEVIPWSEETEVRLIQGFDIGVMPLPDLPWERGKCGFKLLQYMACGKPVVASPVGVNKDIVVDGVNGFLAKTPQQWVSSLRTLLLDSTLRARLGVRGRALVEQEFSLEVQANTFENVISTVVINKTTNVTND
jgi:glycosyltransferase involved in cell wall biosynthesis